MMMRIRDMRRKKFKGLAAVCKTTFLNRRYFGKQNDNSHQSETATDSTARAADAASASRGHSSGARQHTRRSHGAETRPAPAAHAGTAYAADVGIGFRHQLRTTPLARLKIVHAYPKGFHVKAGGRASRTPG